MVVKAISLISGGLDSMLATSIIKKQGVDVEGVNFFTGFCGDNPYIEKKEEKDSELGSARYISNMLNIKLHVIDVFEQYKKVLWNPKYGYGANMNPCLDCKIFMVGQAKEMGFDFIVSGEVVGQRPKSQMKNMMASLIKDTGTEGILIRPLCAKILEETIPERNGLIDREKLYDISGRSRKRQIALAKEFGYEKYAQPSGGCCMLIDRNYCDRLRNIWIINNSKEYTRDDIQLVKIGKHIMIDNDVLLIVGRNEQENALLKNIGFITGYTYIESLNVPAPSVLVYKKKGVNTDLIRKKIYKEICIKKNVQIEKLELYVS